MASQTAIVKSYQTGMLMQDSTTNPFVISTNLLIRGTSVVTDTFGQYVAAQTATLTDISYPSYYQGGSASVRMDIASYRPLAACLMVKMTGLGPDRFDYPGMFYFYQRTSVNTAENVSEGNLARLVAAGRCRMVTANEVYRNNGHKLCWTPANLAERDYAPLVNVPMGAPALGTAESAYGGLVCVAYGLAPGTSMQFELSTIHEFVPDPSGGFFETAKAPEAPGVKDIYDKVLVTAADMGWTNGPVGPTGGTGGPGPRSAMDRGHDAFDTLLGYAPKTLQGLHRAAKSLHAAKDPFSFGGAWGAARAFASSFW